MKPTLHPYARAVDAASPEPLQLPAHVDGQIHIQPATMFLLGAICGAGLLGIGGFCIIALFIP